MWLHFCTFNHDPIGRSTLVDMAAWFSAGLLDSGHKATFSDTHLEPGAINLLWECFHPGMAAQLRAAGVTYGIIATEIPTGSTFNWREEPHWKQRFDAFLDVASGASFIWTMVESTIPFYARFCPTAFIELGFSERLIPPYIDHAPVFDFSFFGLPTPYRVAAIARIRKHAKVEWPKRFLSPAEVGVLIGKTRVGLNFKQSERWPVPSPTRLGRLIMARRGVAAEHTEVPTRQGEIVGLAPAGQDFAEYALQTLNAGWKQRAEKVFADYRSQMPMGRIMEAVLDRTIAGLDVAHDRTQAIPVSRSTPPPVLVMTCGDWNVVAWNGRYYALHRSCGEVDVREGTAALRAKHGRRAVHCARTFELVRARITLQDGWEGIVKRLATLKDSRGNKSPWK